MEENKLFVDNLGKLLEERLNNIESKYNLRLESLNKDLMQLKEAISKEKDEKILEEYKADMNKVQKEIEDSSDKIEKEKQDISNEINFDIDFFKQEITAIDNNNRKLNDLKIRKESLDNDLKQLNDAISNEKDPKIVEEFNKDRDKVLAELVKVKRSNRYNEDKVNEHNNNIMEIHEKYDALIEKYNVKENDNNINSEEIDNDNNIKSEEIDNDSNVISKNIKYNQDKENVINVGSKVLDEMSKDYTHFRIENEDINGNSVSQSEERKEDDFVKIENKGIQNVKKNEINSEEIDNDSNVISKNIKYNQDKENVINIGSKVLDEMSKDYTHFRIENEDINGNSVSQSEERKEDDFVKIENKGIQNVKKNETNAGRIEEDNNDPKKSKIKKIFSMIGDFFKKIGKSIKGLGLLIAGIIRLPKKEENKLLSEGKKVKKDDTKIESKKEDIPLEDLLSNLKEQNLFDELKLNEIKQYADTHGEEEAKNKYAYNLSFAKMDITRKKILEEKQDREFRRELRVNPDKSQISEEKDTKKELEKENDENGER